MNEMAETTHTTHHWVPRATGEGSVRDGTQMFVHICSECGVDWKAHMTARCNCGHERQQHRDLDDTCAVTGCTCRAMHHAS